MRDSVSYSIEDGDIECTTLEEDSYLYIYNLCAPVPDTPAVCSQYPDGAVLQYSDSACVLVGDYDATKDESYWSLIDESDPSLGVQMTYQGNECHHDGEGNDHIAVRNFTIIVPCEDVVEAVPLSAIEPTHCNYELTMPSMYGCPTECPIKNNKLCGGHGHCALDDYSGKPMCFCNEGYTGSDCTSKEESVTSTLVIGLLVTLLCIACVLVAVIFYMIRTLQAYRKDAANYMSLQMEMGALDSDM